MSLADLRREYSLTGLRRKDLAADPLALFNQWFQHAAEAKAGGSRFRAFGISIYKAFRALFGHRPVDPNAMALATADKDGRPSVRMVLLKGVEARGFIFFTNYDSKKGHDLADNPNAALVFYWPDLERQICVSGVTTKLSLEESQAYFKTRPRGARIAAWASRQSQIIADREALEQRFKEMEAQYPGDTIPLPSFWGGYLLAPTRIEFWQGRPNRLHDRFGYTKQADGSWRIERLSP